jgi:hypothetical protein
MKKTLLLITVLVSVLLSTNSCTTAHHCSAYAQINTNNIDAVQNNLIEEDI